MDLLDIIKKRRSIRRYKDKPVEEEKIKKLLEAFRWAPSAGNVQPWFVYIIKNKKIKEELVKAALGQRFISEADTVFVICADLKRAYMSYGKRGETLYVYQDTAAGIQNLLLEAYYLGLGSCWVGAFHEESVAKILNLPSNLRPIAIVPVGYPGESPSPPPRRSIDSFTKVIR